MCKRDNWLPRAREAIEKLGTPEDPWPRPEMQPPEDWLKNLAYDFLQLFYQAGGPEPHRILLNADMGVALYWAMASTTAMIDFFQDGALYFTIQNRLTKYQGGQCVPSGRIDILLMKVIEHFKAFEEEWG